jgi:hypothetical protein
MLILKMTSPANSSNHLESLPLEILEQIASYAPRSARGVSRTMREVAQREFERRYCREPISTLELRTYLQAGPMSLALFPTLSTVIYQLETRSPATCNIYHLVNPVSEMIVGEPNLSYQNTFIKVNYDPNHVATQAQILSSYDQQLIRTLKPSQLLTYAQNADLDLLTQWRILIARAGCPDLENLARNYLMAELDQRRQQFFGRINDWMAQDDDRARLDAFYLLIYFQTYLYINATLLNVWPLQWDWESYTLQGIDIDEVADPAERENAYDFIRRAIDNLYAKTIRGIQRLVADSNQ